mmetsp:Transcript_79720/g.185103  ORF Transcript_79720/g.185103 Transcript_79720/m.185103 type:complete len:132 (+) Transcript_79720:675-1070(+)
MDRATGKVFVGGLPSHLDANDLRQHFRSFGRVKDAVVMVNPHTQKSRGFGFVFFGRHQQGLAVVDTVVKRPHYLGGKFVDVKRAVPAAVLAAAALQCRMCGHVRAELRRNGTGHPSTASSPLDSGSPRDDN